MYANNNTLYQSHLLYIFLIICETKEYHIEDYNA